MTLAHRADGHQRTAPTADTKWPERADTLPWQEDVLTSAAALSEGVQHTAKYSGLKVTGDSERHTDVARHLADQG